MNGYPMPQATSLCAEHDLLPKGGHVLCAVSGGADSVCLLHWLNGLRAEYGFRLTAAHYDHSLRGEQSRRDAEFVRSFVSKCCPGVELVVGSGDVAARAAQNGAGIEETARELRYAFLREAARRVGADVIATAHNAEDNAETLLLHLMRGSGLRGLTGIPPRRGNIIRPLLTTRREEIEAYLRVYGLPHVEDASNADERFARNRVRHRLLPLLEQMQPQFVSHAGKTAQILAQDEGYLTEQAGRELGTIEALPNGVRVSAAAVANAHAALAPRMVRLLLDAVNGDGGSCTAEHLLSVAALCRSGDPSARISLPDGLLARRVYDRLELVREEAAEDWAETSLPLPGSVTLPWGMLVVREDVYRGQEQRALEFRLSCDKTESGIVLRPRRTGDRLCRPNRAEQTVKKLLIDEKIPRHVRNLLPVLDSGGKAAGVAGLGADVSFLPEFGEKCWHILCIPNSSYKEKGSCSHDGT